ncbi:F-box only protein 28 [Ischnura elegans]|uniref:F-box only protein 28 n=1 Tax=Ischnura elegans TaxID=197161 RepID=UPI001ED8746F|nr:F-box only protein 28 [Ischnura elegans]XP_046390806.1 F-box only protein 28 [Ischnura elegans]XP_046390814.1 F-box only protein 28 [Ischnura elegans]
MVSTRLSSIIAGGSNTTSVSNSNTNDIAAEPGPSKSTRHNVPPQGSISDSNVEIVGVSSSVNILSLPEEIFEKIFRHMSFKQVGQYRLVCRQFDRICGSILNSTFQRLQNQMLQRFQGIKSKMPRRESARRNHPLACESDIIETLHMRLTLLQMSFGKHIERKHCCFFAGEILDEVYRILHYINVTPKLARPYKVTDELFDLSTMAMEYFKEHIEPTLPEIPYFGADFLDFTGTFASAPSNKISSSYLCLQSPNNSSSRDELLHGAVGTNNIAGGLCGIGASSSQDDRFSDTTLPPNNCVLRKRIRFIRQEMKRYTSQLSTLRRDLRACKGKIAEQQNQILEYATRLDENDKKNEENSRKFSTLLQELNKCKTELQYWRSKSPAVPPMCSTCGKAILPGEESNRVSELQPLLRDPALLTLEGPEEGAEGVLPEEEGAVVALPRKTPDEGGVPLVKGVKGNEKTGSALETVSVGDFVPIAGTSRGIGMEEDWEVTSALSPRHSSCVPTSWGERSFDQDGGAELKRKLSKITNSQSLSEEETPYSGGSGGKSSEAKKPRRLKGRKRAKV